MQYHWAERSRYPHTADPQAIGDWIAALEDTSLTGLWEAGKRRGSPIRDLLTWDKDKALDIVQRREIQSILSKLHVTRSGYDVRAFLRVRLPDGVAVYRTHEQVMRNARFRQQRLEAAYRQINTISAQWAGIPELQELLEILNKHALVEV